MQRQTATFLITDVTTIKQQLLHWANQYNSCSFLDNNQYHSLHSSIECLVGAGAVKIFSPTADEQQKLKAFLKETNDWLFGHVSYDYKDVLEPSLNTESIDNIGFEKIYFFQPEVVVQLSKNEMIIESLTLSPQEVFNQILAISHLSPFTFHLSPFTINQRISKQSYLQTIQQLKNHILRGDCYELNYCQEFYAEDAVIDTLNIYQQLTQISPNPFSCYYKLQDKYLLCASPERYIKKDGSRLISQPIKGTFKRSTESTEADESLKQQLFASHKDRTENVMIVDLVRNDLSKICKEGTVEVEELFGIYTFPQVHQMISTIAGELDDANDFADILEATFPMGSMTGAPKKRVMQLINEYEQSPRGLYSGAVGYISPNKNFDFNVVIRSILYNATNKYLSYHVGGGITFNSDAESEYEECLLKAAAMRKVLTAD